MLKFISFGSGSSGNCYWLNAGSCSLLIDAGLGTRTLKKFFADYGVDTSIISALLITHDHADHIKSVGCLSAEYGVPVYSTAEVHHGIERNYCVRKKIKPGYERRIEPGQQFEIGPFCVTSFRVPHDSTDNVGYCITYNDITFVLMTDVGHVTDEMKTYISRANHLVIEANYEHDLLMGGPYPAYLKDRITGPQGHLSNESCGNILSENATPGLKNVFLAHLSEENNHPELARKTVEGILRSNGIIAGKDFRVEVLKRKTPSEVYNLL